MRQSSLRGIVTIALLIGLSSNAYGLRTHANMTLVAQQQAIIKNSSLINSLGLDTSDSANISGYYYDMRGNEVRALDQHVRTTFAAMLTRPRAGDIEGALRSFTPAAADRYRRSSRS